VKRVRKNLTHDYTNSIPLWSNPGLDNLTKIKHDLTMAVCLKHRRYFGRDQRLMRRIHE
jgi:hypothetical protein